MKNKKLIKEERKSSHVAVLANWSDGTFSVVVCLNQRNDLWLTLDQMGDPTFVKAISFLPLSDLYECGLDSKEAMSISKAFWIEQLKEST